MCVYINFRFLLFPLILEKVRKVTAFFSNTQIFLFYFSFLSLKCSITLPK